jgi:hypothetical protein
LAPALENIIMNGKSRGAAIRLRGGRDNTVTDNLIIGTDVLHAEDEERLTAARNTAVLGKPNAMAIAAVAAHAMRMGGELAPLFTAIHKEATRPKPDRGRLRELVISARRMVEGAAGNVVATGILQMLSRWLGI